MKQRMWQLLPVIFFVLQTFFVLAPAQEDEILASQGVDKPSQHAPGSAIGADQGKHSEDQQDSEFGSRDEVAVQEALSILQDLQPGGGRLAQFNKPSGVLGHLLFYAKEAFYLLFMNGPPKEDDKPPTDERLQSPQLKKAAKLLDGAAKAENSDAIFLLAEMNFYGNFTHPRNYHEAFRWYSELASNGNSSAQHMVGFMYATGLGGAVERDQAKALLYHTFAAEGGNTKSEMTVAYRHHSGIGTPRNCDEAAYYYKKVADKAVAYARSGPPGGRSMPKESYRWADEAGGVYGEGASVSSAGPNANRDGPHTNTHASLEDVLEYLDLMSRKGDLKATFSLGKLHYEGSRTMKRNVRQARKYFMMVARRYWTKDGKINTNGPSGIEKIASKAAAHVGRMFLRGEDVEQSFEKAATWFKRGIANGDPFCQYQMGLMYLGGHGVPKDAVKAASYFKAASEEDLAGAESHLGALFLDQGDVPTAVRYFELAARHGWMEAFYYLAEIANQGIGRERHCGMAMAYYKIVAEKSEVVHSSFVEANQAYANGDKETALIDSMMAAEQGYENAQSNVAYLLDEQKSILSLDSVMPWKKHRSPMLRNAALALIYWTRSAKQANVDSLVKMGDYYLGGFGADKDLEKASTCYHTAAEGHHSAQALWNLGWMHENGIAVEQDFHMAKRYYDLALETNQEAYLPVKLSLIKLRVRSYWNTITHGRVNSIQADPEPKKFRSLSEWISNFLEYDEEVNPNSLNPENEDMDFDISGGQDPMPGGDDYYDDIDDGILESLIIVGLAATLAFLVYYRQQRQQGQRREGVGGGPPGQQGQAPGGDAQQQGQVQGGGDRGFFPNPGDPEFGQWVAGGVGH